MVVDLLVRRAATDPESPLNEVARAFEPGHLDLPAGIPTFRHPLGLMLPSHPVVQKVLSQRSGGFMCKSFPTMGG